MNARRLRVAGPAEGMHPEDIPTKQIRCRAGHHRFALDEWEPPAPIPRGVSVMFASEGRYKLMEPCLACMAVTGVTYTHPGGAVDGSLKRSIVYGTNWVRLPADQPRGRRLMRGVQYRRGEAQLRAFMGQAITSLADEDRESSVPPVAPVRLRGV